MMDNHNDYIEIEVGDLEREFIAENITSAKSVEQLESVLDRVVTLIGHQKERESPKFWCAKIGKRTQFKAKGSVNIETAIAPSQYEETSLYGRQIKGKLYLWDQAVISPHSVETFYCSACSAEFRMYATSGDKPWHERMKAHFLEHEPAPQELAEYNLDKVITLVIPEFPPRLLLRRAKVVHSIPGTDFTRYGRIKQALVPYSGRVDNHEMAWDNVSEALCPNWKEIGTLILCNLCKKIVLIFPEKSLDQIQSAAVFAHVENHFKEEDPQNQPA